MSNCELSRVAARSEWAGARAVVEELPFAGVNPGPVSSS